jgi:uncharacterized protein YhjY with autotransporter beta-barrel domain/phospholipase/lecithinase/hemolysin
MRLPARLLCAASCLALLVPGAAAASEGKRVERIVAFGDSYADDGNFFELTGIPRPIIYPTGRFSGGTNFVDTMAQLLGVPVDNFAIGGAFTGTGNINGPGIPGFVQQYQSYLAGGGPAAFPRVTPTFSASDLVVVSIGGNDARAYQFGGGTVAGAPAVAAVKVAEATTGLNALVGAGARQITFLAGDVGRLPEVRGTPIAAIGTAFATSFNTGIQSSLANIASQGVTVNYLDLTAIGNVVESNLAAFNLTSAGACPVECVSNPASQSQFLFYVDRVHLTSVGFAIVGQYAIRQVEAPLTFEAQSGLALSAARNFGQTVNGRIDLAEAHGEHPTSFYLVATASSTDGRNTASSLAYDQDSFGVAGGVEHGFGSGAVGLALAYSRPKSEFVSGAGRLRGDAYHAAVYGKFEAGGAFAQAYAGIGRVELDIRRRAVIDQLEASTEGDTIVAGAEAGYLLELGKLKVGPVIGAQYSRAELDGYEEEGDAVLALEVSGQRVSETVGFAGLELEAETEIGELSVRPFAKLLAEKELDASAREIEFALLGAPGIVNTLDSEEGSDKVYGRIEGGASLALGGRLSLELQGSASFEHPEQNEFSGFVGLKVGF